MKIFIKFLFILLLINNQFAWGDQRVLGKEMSRPPIAEIKRAVGLVPSEYQKDVLTALRKSGRNAWELIKLIDQVSPEEREGAAFLIANMPGRDLVALKGDFLVENVHLAYQAIKENAWGKGIPSDIFLNDILPYASINERRDNWREDFYQRFMKIAKKSSSIDDAVKRLNKYTFETLQVSYNPARRPKPDQSPYESIDAHYASCTGLSILLTDALRSVGIPARIVAIAMWPDESGNHTWVEIWDGHWHYVGAAEPTDFDHTWFTKKAAHADAEHPIFATSFKQTSQSFPMRWAPNLKFVPAVEVTENYKHQS